VLNAGIKTFPDKDSHMTVQNPRSRTISIRLSEEEYLGLKRLCAITGAMANCCIISSVWFQSSPD
jgi:uncharacterized protein involved in tellurium resistance